MSFYVETIRFDSRLFRHYFTLVTLCSMYHYDHCSTAIQKQIWAPPSDPLKKISKRDTWPHATAREEHQVHDWHYRLRPHEGSQNTRRLLFWRRDDTCSRLSSRWKQLWHIWSLWHILNATQNRRIDDTNTPNFKTCLNGNESERTRVFKKEKQPFFLKRDGI